MCDVQIFSKKPKHHTTKCTFPYIEKGEGRELEVPSPLYHIHMSPVFINMSELTNGPHFLHEILRCFFFLLFFTKISIMLHDYITQNSTTRKN